MLELARPWHWYWPDACSGGFAELALFVARLFAGQCC